MPKSRLPAGQKAYFATAWCLTLNNYTQKELQDAVEFVRRSNTTYAIIGKEVGEQQTPHLQAYIHFKIRHAFHTLKEELGERWHIEKAKGNDQQNKEYCEKEEVAIEKGTPNTPTSRNRQEKAACCKKAANILSTGSTIDGLYERDPEAYTEYIKHPEAISDHAHVLQTAAIKQNMARNMEEIKLREWQEVLSTELLETPDDRTIIWYHDAEGNTGKTWFSKLLVSTADCIRFENGRSADIKYAYNGQTIVIFDLTRSQEDHFNYEVMESLKNGIFFSSKYESKMKVYPSPHVVVFSNWAPQQDKLSPDRWSVRTDLSQTTTNNSYKDIVDAKTKKEKDQAEELARTLHEYATTDFTDTMWDNDPDFNL